MHFGTVLGQLVCGHSPVDYQVTLCGELVIALHVQGGPPECAPLFLPVHPEWEPELPRVSGVGRVSTPLELARLVCRPQCRAGPRRKELGVAAVLLLFKEKSLIIDALTFGDCSW